MGNLGGGGFMVYRTLVWRIEDFDFQKSARQRLQEHVLDVSEIICKGKPQSGEAAAGVPGTIATIRMRPWSTWDPTRL